MFTITTKVNADIIKEIDDLRKIAFLDENSIFDNFLKLNDLKMKYYDSINWYNVSEEEKFKVLNENYPLGAIVIENYSTAVGLEILYVEARTLSTSAQIFLDILYKYGLSDKIKPFNSEIFNFWEGLAKENLGRPNLILGIYYFEGIGVKKNYKTAQKYLEASQINSSIEDSYYYLGYCYYFNDELEKALNQWDAGLLLEHPDCGYALGVYYRDNKQYKKAIEYFDKVIGIDKYHIEANINISQIYLEGWGVEINPDKAIIYLNNIIEVAPENIDVIINLATAHLEKENYDLATKYYQKAARLGHTDIQNFLKKNGIEW